MQLDVHQPGGGALEHRLRGHHRRGLLADAHDRRRCLHVRHRARGLGRRGASHRMRGARAGVHGEAHPDKPAHGRQRLLPRREGGRLPAGLLRRVPVPHTEQLRAHGGHLRGRGTRHRPHDVAVRLGRRDRPYRRERGDRRRRRPGAHSAPLGIGHQLGRGARSLHRGARGLLGARHPALHHGRVQPDPAFPHGVRRHPPDRNRIPEELHGGVPGGADHPDSAHSLSAHLGRPHRGEHLDGHPHRRHSDGAHLRAAVPSETSLLALGISRPGRANPPRTTSGRSWRSALRMGDAATSTSRGTWASRGRASPRPS